MLGRSYRLGHTAGSIYRNQARVTFSLSSLSVHEILGETIFKGGRRRHFLTTLSSFALFFREPVKTASFRPSIFNPAPMPTSNVPRFSTISPSSANCAKFVEVERTYARPVGVIGMCPHRRVPVGVAWRRSPAAVLCQNRRCFQRLGSCAPSALRYWGFGLRPPTSIAPSKAGSPSWHGVPEMTPLPSNVSFAVSRNVFASVWRRSKSRMKTEKLHSGRDLHLDCFR